MFQSKNIYPKEVKPPIDGVNPHRLNLNDGRDKAVMCLSQEARSYPLDQGSLTKERSKLPRNRLLVLLFPVNADWR